MVQDQPTLDIMGIIKQVNSSLWDWPAWLYWNHLEWWGNHQGQEQAAHGAQAAQGEGPQADKSGDDGKNQETHMTTVLYLKF